MMNPLRMLAAVVGFAFLLVTPAVAQTSTVDSGVGPIETTLDELAAEPQIRMYVPRITVDPDEFRAEMGLQRRPSTLVPLYILQGVLQSVDAYTTIKGMRQGHYEANPIFRGQNAGVMLGTKLVTTATSILMAEKLWKKNKGAAIAVMVASNLVTSAVVANNYRTLGARR